MERRIHSQHREIPAAGLTEAEATLLNEASEFCDDSCGAWVRAVPRSRPRYQYVSHNRDSGESKSSNASMLN